ncbi:MAG: purine-nucleoside phosphorylase [Pseudomonadota bacterium]
MITEAVAGAANAIAERLGADFPKTVLVLGSGLGRFGETMEVTAELSYADIPGFPVSTVQGHAGRLLIGTAGGAPVACMQGRMHLYEGYDPQQLAIPVRTFKRLGAERLILTNAAGSLHKTMGPGALMMIEDHINYSGRNPLMGPNDDDVGLRFFDMTEAYDPALREMMQAAAVETGTPLRHGVYLCTTGPNFETPAEIRMFRQWGADAVGMSTVPECLVARHCGLRVAGLSMISNLAAGISPEPLSHEEVMEEGEKTFAQVSALMTAFLKRCAEKDGKGV